jgi:predicted TIM-barrel fold metal-dependent hydrolase
LVSTHVISEWDKKLTIAGTDHPFFPPLEEDAKEWHSVNANYVAISKAFSTDDKKAQDVLGGNAVRILRLDS